MLTTLQNTITRFRPRPTWHVNHFEAVLGTTLEVRIRADHHRQALTAEAVLLTELDRLEMVFSRFLPESELNRFLAADRMHVSPELLEVMMLAETWVQGTHGAFHPGADALSALWRTGTVPTVAQLEPILQKMSLPLWEINGHHVKRTSSLPVNFNALAKGWIVDQVCRVAAQCSGVHDVLVNIGGDLRHIGLSEVRVAIADPVSVLDNAPALCEVRVQNRAVASSGHSRRGVWIGPKWFSHVIDPRNGQPVQHTLGATVIAPDAASADALATALCVLETEASLGLIETLPETECLIVTADRHIHTSSGFAAFAREGPRA